MLVAIVADRAAIALLLLLMLVAIVELTVAIRLSSVADNAVIAELLLAMLVAIVELTAAIRVSNVADVPALAKVPITPLIDVIAAEFTTIAELFAAMLTLAIDNPAETVLILVVKTPEVDTSAADTALIAVALVEVRADTLAIRDSNVADTLAILVAIVEDTAAILLSKAADVPILARVPITLLIEVMADELTVIAEALAAIDV